jgi:acetylornithine/succinyldiaminopimelate/putrescine aminotransferase/predicted amino acid dehydrogenase/acyl carrier protein
LTAPASAAERTPESLESWLLQHLEQEHGIALESCEKVSIRDLGLDSVELVGLGGQLEELLGRAVPVALLFEELSIADLLRRLLGAADPCEAQWSEPAPAVHPFRSFMNPELGRRLEALSLDRRFVRGSGAWLYDERGRGYLDFLSAYGALPFGHNPPEIWDGLLRLRQSGEPSFATPSYLDAAGELAERLLRLAPPNLKYVAFTNSGAESIEAAIKLCRAATGRRGILSLERSFHGKTLGALSATGNSFYHESFGAPVSDFERVALGDLEQLRERLARRPGHYAALLLEPILGEGGVLVPPAGYLAQAAQLCRADGILIVADEVQTGLGRTGTWFASQDEGFEPDVVALAKALGGGLVPIGAVLYAERAYSKQFALRHSSTFAGGALACRVGIAALERIERDGSALLQHVKSCGQRLREALEAIRERHPSVLREVRGRGFMLGLSLSIDRRWAPSNLLYLAAEQDWLGMLASGYLLAAHQVRVAPTLNGGNVLRVAPPLTASWQECQIFAERLERALEPFSEGDSGRVMRTLLSGKPVPESAARTRPAPRARPARRFGFLVHPQDGSDLRRLDASLDELGEDELSRASERLSDVMEPFALSDVCVESEAGGRIFGEFIVVPETAQSLMARSGADAAARVRSAIEFAAQRGAEFVGLGGFTSIITGGGLAVTDCGLPLTNGNAFTAVSGHAAIELAFRRQGRSLEGACAVVVGAGGCVGSAVALLLAGQVGRLILVGNPQRGEAQTERALTAVAAQICRELSRSTERGPASPGGAIAAEIERIGAPPQHAPAEAFEALARRIAAESGAFLFSSNLDLVLPLADLVVTATNATGVLLRPGRVRSGTVVCDFSRPRNLRPQDWDAHPDALVIDGGIVEVPGRPEIGPFGLPRGYAFACMAETMLCCLDGRSQSASVGQRLSAGELRAMQSSAERHGFHVRGLSRFDRMIEEPSA